MISNAPADAGAFFIKIFTIFFNSVLKMKYICDKINKV